MKEKELTEQVKSEEQGKQKLDEQDNSVAKDRQTSETENRETIESDHGSHRDEEEDQKNEENEEIIRLTKELEELKASYLRVQADFDNFRKRTRTEREAAAKYRSQSVAEQLLPVLDNFERALAVETTNEESTSILTGVDMVYRQLKDALGQEGVEEIPALGEPFDPHVHQAVMQEKSEEHESGIVIEVLQKGYRLKDRVLRPTMVKVSE